MKRSRIFLAGVLSITAPVTLATAVPSGVARADVTTAISSFPYEQHWSDTNLITVSNSWSGVVGMQGYQGNELTALTGTDPQTVLADGAATTTHVVANSNATNTAGGLVEVEASDPTIAVQGSGTADAPHLVIRLDLTGQSDMLVSYNLRDLDASADDAIQPVALQYRVGASGPYTNIPAAFQGDATLGGSATLVTPVAVELPAATDNQSDVFVRIITTNAVGNDELVGIDDVVVAAAGVPLPLTATDPGDQTFLTDLPIDPITLTATGGVAPYTFAAGPLPDGLTLAGDTISGTPTTAGTTVVEVEVTDSAVPPATAPTEFTITVAAQGCSAAVDPISSVQGAGDTSPCAGETVTIEGIVVGDYEGACTGTGIDQTCNLRGFYVQSADAAHDADPATSEAVFVFHGSEDTVAVGDAVRVTGVAAEFQGQTQIGFPTELLVLSSGNPVTPTPVALPMSSPGQFEQYEGMLVQFDQELTVTETFHLARSGEVRVSAGGRRVQPTAVVEPGPEAVAMQAANNLNYLIVDDAANTQNPDPYVFAPGGDPMTAGNTLRGGDTVTGATGVMTYTWAGFTATGNGNAYRLRPQSPSEAHVAQIPFVSANPRPTDPPDVGGSLKIVGFNVLNYFRTLDVGTQANCGVLGARQECRGAETALELQRQHDKLIAALVNIDADVYGFAELENTELADGSAVDVLGPIVDSLNAVAGPGVWAAVDTGILGTDTIRVGLIYRTDKVELAGDWAAMTAETFPGFDDDNNRPALAVPLRELATGGELTVVVNHWKSKGSCPAAGDPQFAGNNDTGDGASCWNAARVNAAESLLAWLGTHPTGLVDDDVLVFGDLNSYAMEAPLDVLRSAGYVDAVQQFSPGAYSYVFDGQWGTLDYAFASPGLAAQLTGAADYHINADEPPVIDYNTNFKTANNVAVLYAPDQYRTSDHDPAIVGLALASDVVTVTVEQAAGQPDPAALRSDVRFTVTFSEAVTGFGPDDLVTTGGGVAPVISGAGAVYTVTFPKVRLFGPITVSVAAGAATDVDGNASEASTSTDNVVVVVPPGHAKQPV